MKLNKIQKIIRDKRGIVETPTALVIILIVCMLLILSITLVGSLSSGITLGNTADNVAKQIQVSGEITKSTVAMYEEATAGLDITEPSLEITVMETDGTTQKYLYKTDASGSKNYSIDSMKSIQVQLGCNFTVKVKGKTYIGLSTKDKDSKRLDIGGKGQGVSEIYWKSLDTKK